MFIRDMSIMSNGINDNTIYFIATDQSPVVFASRPGHNFMVIFGWGQKRVRFAGEFCTANRTRAFNEPDQTSYSADRHVRHLSHSSVHRTSRSARGNSRGSLRPSYLARLFNASADRFSIANESNAGCQ